jgi:hypothetical protein
MLFWELFASIGTAGMNLARNAALTAGLPVTVPGQTMDRQCASGLMAIATRRQTNHGGWHGHCGGRGARKHYVLLKNAYFDSMSGDLR